MANSLLLEFHSEIRETSMVKLTHQDLQLSSQRERLSMMLILVAASLPEDIIHRGTVAMISSLEYTNIPRPSVM